jgi:hypothetical protein
MSMLNTKIDETTSVIGTIPTNMNPRFLAPTVWGTITEVASFLDSTKRAEDATPKLASQGTGISCSDSFGGLPREPDQAFDDSCQGRTGGRDPVLRVCKKHKGFNGSPDRKSKPCPSH